MTVNVAIFSLFANQLKFETLTSIKYNLHPISDGLHIIYYCVTYTENTLRMLPYNCIFVGWFILILGIYFIKMNIATQNNQNKNKYYNIKIICAK